MRNVVKDGGPDVIENFEKMFKEIKIEGKRKTVSSSVMYTEQLLRTPYTEAEIEVIELLDVRYGRSRTEKVGEAIEDYFKFREDQYEDDDELMLAMSELRQRRVDLEMTFDEFHTVWMLQKLKKTRKMKSFEQQTLREVVKTNGPDVVKNFEEKFKEIRVEGKRKCLKDTATH